MKLSSSTTNVAVASVSQMWAKQVELLLLTELEKAEGRVPSNEEVYRHAYCRTHPDGVREYVWKEKILLRIDSWHVDDDGHFVLNYSTRKS